MGCIREQVTVVGKWGSVPWGTVRRHKLEMSHFRDEGAGVFTHQLLPAIGWE